MQDSKTEEVSRDIPDGGHQLELFEKAIGGEMTLTQFQDWMDNNLGPKSFMKILRLAAFMSCCDVIAQDISKATLRLKQRLENNTTKTVMPRKHPIAGFLALEPNPRHTWKTAIEMMVYWLCFTNNAGAVIIRDNKGGVLEIVPVQTGRVNVKVNGREVFYEVTASTQQEQALLGQSFMVVPERDFIHIRTRTLDGMYGYGNDIVGADVFEIMQNIQTFRSDLFSDEGQIRGVFTRKLPDAGDKYIPDEIFQRLRRQFKALMSKVRDYSEPVVLEGDWDFKSIASKPVEMQLTDQYKAQVLEVCQIMGVPPHKVFLNDGSKYNNMETQEKEYVSHTLIPRAKDIQGEFSKKLLKREERLDYTFEFDQNEMMVKDISVEMERVTKAVERSLMTLDEGRTLIGLNPYPNGIGNVRLVPTNMALVDENNNVILGGASNPSSDTAPSDVPEVKPEQDPEKTAPLRLVK